MAGLTATRYGLMALGGIGLLAGLTGALVLLGVPMPAPARSLGADHGALMTLGFLGTLISLERAVALGRGWGYLAPLLTGAGGLALIADAPALLALTLFTGGAAVFVAMYVAFDRIERSLHTSVQAVGALAWLGAAILLLGGRTATEVVPWLAAFLVLTIAGERLELSRLAQLTNRARIGFVAGAAIFCIGVAMSVASADIGMRVGGVGLVALAAWLARNDVARRTVRIKGTPRFVALSLLSGYTWLAVGGACWLLFGATPGGPAYDAMLHAVFLGFVMSMVFGHAPIILPAVLGTPLPFRPRFYVHLGLLHLGLLLRIGAGDLFGVEAAWRLGGVLNVTALLVFVISSALAIAMERRSSLRAVPAPSS
jgi:hypothetical protein